MSFTVMKSVPIFYLHCTCYKFRTAVLICNRINVIRVKSLEGISRRSVRYLTKTISIYSARFVFPTFLYISRQQVVRFPCLEQIPDYSDKISHRFIRYFCTFFNVRKSLPSRVNFYLINLLSKRWCQKPLSKTMQHVGLLLIGFSLPQVR